MNVSPSLIRDVWEVKKCRKHPKRKNETSSCIIIQKNMRSGRHIIIKFTLFVHADSFPTVVDFFVFVSYKYLATKWEIKSEGRQVFSLYEHIRGT